MQKVHFLTPSYDGTVHISTAWSLMLEMFLLKDIGIISTWDFYPGCCYPEIARNMLCKKFLEGDYTDAFFIDSDMQWEPGGAVKMLRHDVDVVAGSYPYKQDCGIEPLEILKKIQIAPDLKSLVESTREDYEKETHRYKYPVIFDVDEDGRPIVDAENGLISAIRLPTGFMRIRRNVFETMIKEVGEQIIVEDLKDPDNPDKYYSFFDTPKIGKTKWGEDFHFCNAWRGLGGKVWIEPDITFWHHGFKAFKGNFHDHLRGLPGGGGPPEKHWKFTPRQ